VPDPIVLRLSRPFRSIDEFLEVEADWIMHQTMLLVDAEELPVDTLVRFGVQLASGQWPIKAEAVVTGYQRRSASGPSGLMVRFKRYGAATKQVMDRAAEIRAQRKIARPSPDPVESSPASMTGHDAEESTATPEVEPISVAGVASEPGVMRSGVHARVVRPVGAPVNREELLARLRQRAARTEREDSGALAADGNEPRAPRATA
jgi:hypothetical protein